MADVYNDHSLDKKDESQNQEQQPQNQNFSQQPQPQQQEPENKHLLEQEIEKEFDRQTLAKQIVANQQGLKSLEEKMDMLLAIFGARNSSTQLDSTNATNNENFPDVNNQKAPKFDNWQDMYNFNKKGNVV